MCMCNGFTLLYSRNQHNNVNQLYSNKNFKKKKQCSLKRHLLEKRGKTKRNL